MTLSDVIVKLTKELALRGDCELVTKDGSEYVILADVEVFRTPYQSPIPNAGYIELQSPDE